MSTDISNENLRGGIRPSANTLHFMTQKLTDFAEKPFGISGIPRNNRSKREFPSMKSRKDFSLRSQSFLQTILNGRCLHTIGIIMGLPFWQECASRNGDLP